MSKIKKIHGFGTSFTEGGGFEFDMEHVYKNATPYHDYEHIFKKYGIGRDKHDYSWLNFLSLYIDNTDIINHAKSGYGNQRLVREVFDLISDSDFKKDEELLILEFSHVGRYEVFHKDIGDYVVINYHWDDDEHKQVVPHSLTRTYFYEDESDTNTLKQDEELFWSWFKKSYDETEILKEVNRNFVKLINTLKQNNINYLVVSEPICLMDNYIKLATPYNRLYHGNDGANEFFTYYTSEGLDITNETESVYTEGHLGIIANNNLARVIHNKLVDMNIIESNKLNTDIPYKTVQSLVKNNFDIFEKS